MLLNCILFLLCLAFNLQAHSIDVECPDEFQIRQEASMRTFSVMYGDERLGTIVNSDYGQFDFYDSIPLKLCTNLMDALYDNSSNLLGFIEWKEDPETQKWFWEKKCLFCAPTTHMVLFSDVKTPLCTLDEEGEGGAFVFRECETGKPIAIGIWSWSLLGSSSIAKFDRLVQNWDVIIVDRSLLTEKQISPLFLSWALLKHSQLHFPDPHSFPYEKQAYSSKR